MIQRLLLAACFCAAFLTTSAFSEAAVVDESENYALLEEQQGAYEPPAAHDGSDFNNSTEEPALAKDDQGTDSGRNAGLLDKIQGLQQEIQELRGQLEVQAHTLKLLQEQQLSFYKDLDARLRDTPGKGITTNPTATDLSIGTPPPALPVIQPVVTPERSNPADEQISYLAAYEFVKNKRFDEGLNAMQTFVTRYPHGGYTANAEYWLGELYMIKANYPEAIAHFNIVLQNFPSSSKSAASLLKVGYALAASGKTAEARLTLQDVIKKYPDTDTARLANTKLTTLKNQ
ncbi:MAG TPA: tol-pal system protein YbgF [Legionella sp.]|nr:tol-pal system protein YbgF [Legionella sp.]